MTTRETKAIESDSTFIFDLDGDTYADLIVALSYAWENVKAEDGQYNDRKSRERVARVERVRKAVCSDFTISQK